MRPAQKMFSWTRIGFRSSVFAAVALVTSATFAQAPGAGGTSGGTGTTSTTSPAYTGEVTAVTLTKSTGSNYQIYLQGCGSFTASVHIDQLHGRTFRSNVSLWPNPDIGNMFIPVPRMWHDSRDKNLLPGQSFSWSMGNGTPGTPPYSWWSTYVMFAELVVNQHQVDSDVATLSL